MAKAKETEKVITPLEALKSAPTASEILVRPDVYENWYNGVRKEAIDNG